MNTIEKLIKKQENLIDKANLFFSYQNEVYSYIFADVIPKSSVIANLNFKLLKIFSESQITVDVMETGLMRVDTLKSLQVIQNEIAEVSKQINEELFKVMIDKIKER